MNKNKAYLTTLLYIILIDAQIDKEECKSITQRLNEFIFEGDNTDIENLIEMYTHMKIEELELLYKNSVIFIKDNVDELEQNKFLDFLKEVSRGEYISRTIEDEIFLETKSLIKGYINIDDYFETHRDDIGVI